MIYLIILIIFCLLLAFLNISIIIDTAYESGEGFKLKISLQKLVLFDSEKKSKAKKGKTKKQSNKKKSKVNNKKKENFNLDKLNNKINFFFDIFNDIKYVLKSCKKKVKAEPFLVSVTFGTEDAYEVGVGTGILWGVIGTVYPVFDTALIINNPQIFVNPKYNKNCFEMVYKGVYKIKIKSILFIMLQSLKAIINIKTKLKNGGAKNG